MRVHSIQGERMGARENLQRLVDRKRSEIADLEQRLRDARVYMQALADSLKALPKEQNGAQLIRELRPGSALAMAQEFLRATGKPQHVSDILKALDKENTKEARVSLSGSLAGYVKERRIFTRPSPNTFGLIEFGTESTDVVTEELLPEDFGQ